MKTFEAGGQTYELPPIDPSAAAKIPGWVTVEAVMKPKDDTAQLRLGLAMIEAIELGDATREALYSLSTEEMLTVIGSWMGESDGSSSSSGNTEEPSNTTSESASA